MEFKITEAEVRAMADFEAEVGCDVSAGLDWGVHLDRVMDLALDRRDFSRGQFGKYTLQQLIAQELEADPEVNWGQAVCGEEW